MNKNFIKGAIIAGVIVIGGGLFSLASFERIKPGYAAVVYNANGGIEKDVLTQGWKFVSPWKKAIQYPVSTEQGYLSKDSREGSEGDDSFLIPTKSGKTVNVDLEYSYHFDPEKLSMIFTKFRGQSGKDIETIFMRGKLKAWSGEISSKFDVLDIYGDKRSDLNVAAFKYCKEKLLEFGVVLETLNFSRIEPDAETMKAIQARVNAQQKLEQLKIEKQNAELEAQKKRTEAEGNKIVTVTNAQAESESNKILMQSMTPQLVEYKKLEVMQKQAESQAKWPVSTFVNGGNTTPFLNIPSPSTK